MTKSEYWEALCAKRPALRDPKKKIEFTSENLKKMADQLYDIAHGAGRKMSEDLKHLHDLYKGKQKDMDEMMSMFEGLLGGKRP